MDNLYDSNRLLSLRQKIGSWFFDFLKQTEVRDNQTSGSFSNSYFKSFKFFNANTFIRRCAVLKTKKSSSKWMFSYVFVYPVESNVHSLPRTDCVNFFDDKPSSVHHYFFRLPCLECTLY